MYGLADILDSEDEESSEESSNDSFFNICEHNGIRYHGHSVSKYDITSDKLESVAFKYSQDISETSSEHENTLSTVEEMLSTHIGNKVHRQSGVTNKSTRRIHLHLSELHGNVLGRFARFGRKTTGKSKDNVSTSGDPPAEQSEQSSTLGNDKRASAAGSKTACGFGEADQVFQNTYRSMKYLSLTPIPVLPILPQMPNEDDFAPTKLSCSPDYYLPSFASTDQQRSTGSQTTRPQTIDGRTESIEIEEHPYSEDTMQTKPLDSNNPATRQQKPSDSTAKTQRLDSKNPATRQQKPSHSTATTQPLDSNNPATRQKMYYSLFSKANESVQENIHLPMAEQKTPSNSLLRERSRGHHSDEIAEEPRQKHMYSKNPVQHYEYPRHDYSYIRGSRRKTFVEYGKPQASTSPREWKNELSNFQYVPIRVQCSDIKSRHKLDQLELSTKL